MHLVGLWLASWGPEMKASNGSVKPNSGHHVQQDMQKAEGRSSTPLLRTVPVLVSASCSMQGMAWDSSPIGIKMQMEMRCFYQVDYLPRSRIRRGRWIEPRERGKPRKRSTQSPP
ncbi:hypothetical protein ACFX2H_010831 [Malus domestica]